jgi:hypothetical protein
MVHWVFDRKYYECNPNDYGDAVKSNYYDMTIDGKPDPYGKKLFTGVYYMEGSNDPFSIEGFYDNPYLSWRYRKNTGETYGTCPAFDAMPSIWLLNQCCMSYARIVQQEGDPTLLAIGEYKDGIRKNPGAVNYSEMGAEVRRLFPSGNSQLNIQMQERLIDEIDKIFRVDVYRAMEAGAGVKTAYEASQLKSEAMALLSTEASRQKDEFLDPLIKRVFGMALRGGRLPEEVKQLKGIKIDYQGPLYQEQRKYHKIGKIVNAMQATAPVIQMFPESAIVWDPEQLIREILAASSIPSVTYRDPLEVKQIQQAQAQAAAEQQRAAAIAQLGETYNKTIKAPEVGSGAEAVMNALGAA